MSLVHKHHRKRRSQGGDDSPENIIDLTPEIHELVHRNPALAYEHGLLVHSYNDPAEIVPDIGGFLRALEGRTPVGTETDQGLEEAMHTTPLGEEIPHRHEGVEKECPRCHGKGKVTEKPKDPSHEPSPERKKVTWAVRVPKDERENGYEVLEALVEAAIDKMANLGLIRDRNKGAAYYTVVAALHNFVTEGSVASGETG